MTRRRALAAGTLLAVAGSGKRLSAWADDGTDPKTGAMKLASIHRLQPALAPPPNVAWTEQGASGPRPRTLADYKGQGVVLNAWATWCGPCVAEMPSLAALAASLAGTGIAVLPISMDHAGPDAIRAFYAAHAIAGLPVLTDLDGRTRAAFGVGAIPVTFLIGRDGMVHGRLDGAADWTEPGASKTLMPFFT